ncbi:hypothetical protein MTBBW1_1040043 [Desulfamplus magnetovallimortis]|uniref:histidine kinase n=1 Tax=Desulfamplus magnetovallimortis TaxID=1246637 RepID=A0A1W1H560_9BACT|nr:histidine kinase dimerization/phosphoacceptor domain -containing protein [Desulfamplus magnetovallimortis]SLM27586.1 hypothetical protein MTBBW1_1040043 [Desulfamplus magnetovallimortis]
MAAMTVYLVTVTSIHNQAQSDMNFNNKENEKELLIIQRDLGIALSSTSDFHKALKICIDSVLRIDGVDFAGIYLNDSSDGSFKLHAHSDIDPEFLKLASCYEFDSPQAALLYKKQSVFSTYEKVLNDLKLPRKEINQKLSFGIHALGMIPMLHEGKITGCLNVASGSLDYFEEYICYALESIASQMAGALARIQSINDLKINQQNFKTLFDNLDDFLFVLDEQGMIVEFNPVVPERLCYTEKELLRMSVLELHPPERRLEAQEIITEMLAGRLRYCPIPLLKKNGEHIPVETAVALGQWNRKKAIFGISRDITRRLESEKARKVSENRLRVAIDAMDEGFALYDSEDRLVLFNSQYKELHSPFTEMIMTGKKFEDIIRYGVRNGYYKDALGKEEEWIQWRIKRHHEGAGSLQIKSENDRWIKISECRTEDGCTVGFLVDITEMKQKECLIEQALAEKETLLRELHHRVKNNMQVISSLLKLQASKLENHSTMVAFEEAESRIHSMALVHETLYQSDNFAEISLQLYFEKLSGYIMHMFSDIMELTVHVDAESVVLPLKQSINCGLIATELLTNSLKHAFPENVKIHDVQHSRFVRIEVKERDNYLQFSVADNGKGFPKGFNWKESRTLGLRLVRELVERELRGTLELVETQGICWIISWNRNIVFH